jgi:hypothetical protein
VVRRDGAITERSITMSKSVKKQQASPVAAPNTNREAEARKGKPAKPESKQSRVIAMLGSPAGATMPTMMRATGWQQHSVRGFLAGVVQASQAQAYIREGGWHAGLSD